VADGVAGDKMPAMRGFPPLTRFHLLYGLLFAAFGVRSPFLPPLLQDRGLRPEAIGLVLAASTGVRLLAGPAAGRLADRLGAHRLVLAACAVAAGLLGLGYLPAWGFWPLFSVGVGQAAMLAPIIPLADALALGAATRGPRGVSRNGFEYGWVRGAGSAAFVVGVAAAGSAVGRFGIDITVAVSSVLLVAAAVACAVVPRTLAGAAPVLFGHPLAASGGWFADGDLRTLLRDRVFRRLLLVAALVQGSHALHDSFAVIRWQAAGIDPATTGLLWSESVAAEVVVFLFLGSRLLDRLGPAGASMLASAAGVLRWAVMAETAQPLAMALVQPLHGLTFALQHLACMRLIAVIVPVSLAATAQSIYGTLCIGLATALLTLASGPLYARFGAGGFWVMASICAISLPACRGLRLPRFDPS